MQRFASGQLTVVRRRLWTLLDDVPGVWALHVARAFSLCAGAGQMQVRPPSNARTTCGIRAGNERLGHVLDLRQGR